MRGVTCDRPALSSSGFAPQHLRQLLVLLINGGLVFAKKLVDEDGGHSPKHAQDGEHRAHHLVLHVLRTTPEHANQHNEQRDYRQENGHKIWQMVDVLVHQGGDAPHDEQCHARDDYERLYHVSELPAEATASVAPEADEEATTTDHLSNANDEAQDHAGHPEEGAKHIFKAEDHRLVHGMERNGLPRAGHHESDQRHWGTHDGGEPCGETSHGVTLKLLRSGVGYLRPAGERPTP
mmetsp:Transcript_55909/g.154837  ORF Transcript_55909/g.154837 Transcript_55909/m.154837 type:complete len:236 (-) Transcript_55909:12-719(-)